MLDISHAKSPVGTEVKYSLQLTDHFFSDIIREAFVFLINYLEEESGQIQSYAMMFQG